MRWAYGFAENRPEVIEAFAGNPKMKGRIYGLISCERWRMGKDGVLLLDIDPYLLRRGYYDEGTSFEPIIDGDMDIPISTHDHLTKTCRCRVSYLPEESSVKYLKMIAQQTRSVVGIGMEHERGDALYDIYCWIFDYREKESSPHEKGYIEVADGIRFFPESRGDLIEPDEYIYTCYERNESYINFYLRDCPAKVRNKWWTPAWKVMLPFEKMNEIFGITSFPHWRDLYKIDFSDFRLHL